MDKVRSGWRPLLLVVFLGTIVTLSVGSLVDTAVDVDIVTASIPLGFGAVGSLLLVRAAWHPVGWLMVGTGVAVALALGGYPGAPPEYVQVSAPWMSVFALLAWTTLVFPTGRLDSWAGRTRTVARGAVVVLVALMVADLVALIVTVVSGLPPRGDLVVAFYDVGYLVVIGLLLIGAVSLVARFRRSTGERRAQLGWVVASLALVMITLIVTELVALALREFRGVDLGDSIYFGMTIALLLVPVSVSVAILRYRLYDLGRLVTRTVSFTVVAGLLALVYTGAVFLLRDRLPFEGPLPVAASTLAVAGLFNPVRRRVQSRVERRFNRSHYDAQRVADDFAGSLREEVDPDRVLEGWVEVVSATMQPSTIAVWRSNP